MTVFWGLVVTLLLLAACFILVPLLIWRKRPPVDELQSREEANLGLYRERLSELDEQLQRGDIDTQRFEQLKQEAETTLLGDVDDVVESVQLSSKAGWAMPLALCLSMAVVSVMLYLRWGASDELSLATALNQPSPEQSIEQLTGKLERVLDRQPDNYQGYYLLGRSYMTMGRFQDAVDAFARVVKLVGDDPEPLSQFAQALFLAQNSRVTPQVEDLVDRTLTVQPDNVTALGLKGIISFENKQYRNAIKAWESLLAVTQDPQSRAALTSGIAQARVMLGGAPEEPARPEDQSPVSGLEVRVVLSDQLKALPPTTRVFIFARATDGPPMPLAVAPVTVGELPKTVLLNDAMAMMPELKLSGFDKVDVVARISKSGDVRNADYEALVKGVEVSSRKTVELEIDGGAG
ncbi:c-type cytochrome biogenesis protein CcmI [Kistimonas scapharcae]|uniref:C-type cytochrome biogenesis protein CcmI n=1 Tax=Kistimonas scapharcae TaxID=1036133 RepID=A0ABP8V7S8_9GAMM